MHQVRKGKYLDFTSAAVGLLSPQAVIEKQVMQHGGKQFFFLVCWHQIQNVHMLAILFYTYLLIYLIYQILLSSSAVLQIGLSVAFASSLHTVSHS